MAGLNDLTAGKKYKDVVFGGMKSLEETCGVMLDFPRLPLYGFGLDHASGGGLPMNTPVQLFGTPGGGKTLLAHMWAKALSKTCMRCFKPTSLCDCNEHPLILKTLLIHLEGLPPDRLRFESLGYDIDNNMVIALPETGEEACDLIEAGVASDDCGLVIVDSLSNLTPASYLENSYVDSEVGGQAKLTTRLFKRLGFKLVKEAKRGHNLGMIFISQMRANLNRANKYAPADGAAGGFGQKHGFRLSMRVNQVKSEDIDESSGMKETMRFSVNLGSNDCKTQIFTMGAKAEYKIAFSNIDGYSSGQFLDAKTVLKVAKDELGILVKEKDGYVLQGTPFKFRVLAEVEDVFRSGEWTNPETGEVIQNADDALRHYVLTVAKERAIAEFVDRRGEVLKVKPIVEAA